MALGYTAIKMSKKPYLQAWNVFMAFHRVRKATNFGMYHNHLCWLKNRLLGCPLGFLGSMESRPGAWIHSHYIWPLDKLQCWYLLLWVQDHPQVHDLLEDFTELRKAVILYRRIQIKISKGKRHSPGRPGTSFQLPCLGGVVSTVLTVIFSATVHDSHSIVLATREAHQVMLSRVCIGVSHVGMEYPCDWP